MIRILLSLATLLIFTTFSNAQGIKFEKLDWEENLKKAQAKNKLVYVDFYTTWCGPCKFMAKKYFPAKEAGDFYNKNFFCLKIDAEKEGLALAKKYNVSGYPTNLFINPMNEEVVYKTMGAPGEIAGFLKNGATAVEEFNDPMTLQQYADKMEKGDSSKEFTMKYLKKLTRLDKPNQWPLDVYSHLYFKKNIDSIECYFMNQYLLDINNKTFEIFVKNRKAYNKFASDKKSSYKWKDALSSKIYTTNRTAAVNNDGELYRKCVSTALKYLPEDDLPSTIHYLGSVFYENNDSAMLRINDYEYANKLVIAKNSYFKKLDSEALASVLKQLEWQSKEWPPNMVAKLDSMKDAFSKDIKYSKMVTARASSHLNSQAWFVFEQDQDRWPEALKWAKKDYAMAKEAEQSEAATADTYANLLYVNGNKKEAIKIQKEAIKKLTVDQQDTSEYEKTLKKFTGE